MSHGDGPPPMFEGDDFPYWKVRMETYLEAYHVDCLRATTEGFPKPKPGTPLTEIKPKHAKWNVKARNIIFKGIGKEVFNLVWNYKDAYELWMNICAFYEGTISEHEERYHLVMYKLNTFAMLPNVLHPILRTKSNAKLYVCQDQFSYI